MRTKAANRLLLGWVILLLLLGAAACTMLYQYLADYEISRPELVMEELMREKSPDDWYGEIRAFAQDGLSEFEDAGAVLDAYYEGSLRGAGFSYRRDTVHSTEENPVFVVRAGSVNFASVTLAPAENGELRFGRHRWEVKSIEPAPLLNNLRGVSVEVLAFPGQELLLNGRPLTAAQVVEENVPCESLSELERHFPEPPGLLRYRVERMVGDISVTAADGTILPPESDGAVVRYDASGLESYGTRFFAPADVEVSVCGARLTEADAVSASPGILEGLEIYVGEDGADTLLFEIEGLHVPPEVTVRGADGAELGPLISLSGTPHYYHGNDPDCEAEVRPWAEAFFQAYLDYSMHKFSDYRQYTLLQKTHPKSHLYRYFQDSRDTMLWAVGTTVDELEELRFTDFHRVNADCVLCNVRYRGSFTMNTKDEALRYEEESTAELCFILRKGEYLCAAMSFVTD